MKKLVDFSADSIKVILLNNSHAFDADHDVLTDISTNELATAGGYTAGGVAIGNPTVTQDDTNNCATFDGNDVAWTSATFSAYHAALYNDTVSDNLVASIDFGGLKSVTAGTFTISWSANGIYRLT
jgi:hypothetical protein